MKLRIRFRASTSPLRGYAQHERPFSARPEPFGKLRTGSAERSRRMSETLTSRHCPKEGLTTSARSSH
jgi:hypothetical protein